LAIKSAVHSSSPQDKPLAGADPVIWHSFGITHLPRLEDFPIMPVEVVGFTFKPWGFHK
jgi:primary-amine oxidase